MTTPRPTPAESETTGIPFDVHGYSVSIAVPDARARDTVARIFGAFGAANGEERHAATPTTRYLLSYDGQHWSAFADDTIYYTDSAFANALNALEWHIVDAMLTLRRDLFHLHGASLRAPSGESTTLVLGESGSGKTTLTLGLIARGFLPYADDVTLIEPATLLPQTFRRAFHTDERTRAIIEALEPPCSWDFDAAPPGYFVPPQWAESPAPIRTVLFPRLRPHEAPRLDPLPVAEAVVALLPFSLTLANDPALALPVAARIAEQARCFRLSTGDLDATARMIAALVEETPVSVPDRPEGRE